LQKNILKIYKNISLRGYNSFRIDSRADSFISFEKEEEVISYFCQTRRAHKKLLILGCGSNILFTGNFDGTVLHSDIRGITIEEKHTGFHIISAASGVKWDDLVAWSVKNGYNGIENLSLIPGSVGASPVQNIGAYGVEVKDTIEKVRVVSISDGAVAELNSNECSFGYRNSIFKSEAKGRYFVTRVFYKLSTDTSYHLDYGSLYEEAAKLGSLSLSNIRQAVINIRTSKLPDPEITGNAGSFFKNPVVSAAVAESLKNRHPELKMFDDPSGGVKLAAGWLIEKCGWSGKRNGNAGVHDKQALVLVNYGVATGLEIFQLSEKIRKSVFDEFGVELEREVEIAGTI
jgi:UDP-N-acetylmuramate dehydrogenase